MHAGFCSVHHHNPLCWQVPHEHPGVNAAPRCSRTPLSMTSILLTRAFQKCVFSLAADSRRQHRSGYLVSAFYSQLELKWEKKTPARKKNQIFKCGSKDTVHVCFIWQQSPSKRCSPSPRPSLPSATVFYLSVLLMQLSVGILFGGKKRAFNVWAMLQSLKWLHSNHRGCEIRHRAGCQRVRGARSC